MVRTSTKGILQSDILIRTAIMEALDEVRKTPWLLDFVFSWMVSDELTRSQYGEKELDEAKRWFLNSEIIVTMSYRVDRPQLPCIAIELIDSVEDVATLGDVNLEGPYEEIDGTETVIQPQPVLGPFTPKSYNSSTGKITLPDNLNTIQIFEGNIIFDIKTNKGYQIISIYDDSSFFINPGVNANFTKAYIAPLSSLYTVALESLSFRENYRLRCYVNTAPVHLTFLHSILLFQMLRKKEDLLEGRGFERSTINSGPIGAWEGEGNVELTWYRDITTTGYVRQYWPKKITPKLDGINFGIKIMDSGSTPPSIQDQVINQGWELEDDQFSALKG